MNKLQDPYDDLERDRTSVRTADGTIGLRLGTNDYQHIKTTHGRKDTLQRTFYILLTKLVNELKRHNIGPNYEPDAFERALNGATITIGGPGVYGGPATLSNPEVPIGNDGPRTPLSSAKLTCDGKTNPTKVSKPRKNTRKTQ